MTHTTIPPGFALAPIEPTQEMLAHAMLAAAPAMTAQPPVAWCQLALGGKTIAYFDGKPMVMPGPVGNDCHPDPLYAAPAAAPAWQPIESAPTDGRTLLLGYFNVRNKWRTVRGQWFSQAEIDESWEEPETGEPGWYETVVESDDIPNVWRCHPTHWMPLPAAPEIQCAATGDQA